MSRPGPRKFPGRDRALDLAGVGALQNRGMMLGWRACFDDSNICVDDVFIYIYYLSFCHVVSLCRCVVWFVCLFENLKAAG